MQEGHQQPQKHLKESFLLFRITVEAAESTVDKRMYLDYTHGLFIT